MSAFIDKLEKGLAALFALSSPTELVELRQRFIDAGLAPETADKTVWAIVVSFLEAWADGDEATPALFDNIVEATISSQFPEPPAPEPEAVAPPVSAAHAPELLHPAHVRRVFQPAPFSIEVATQFDIAVVKFVGQLSGFRYSHEMPGFCFDNGLDTLTVLLETGELVFVPKTDFISTAISLDPEDYEDVSPLLMLNLRVLCQSLLRAGLISKEQSDFICSERFGKFKAPVSALIVSGTRVADIERVFKDSVTTGVSNSAASAAAGLRCKVTTADSKNYYVALQIYSGTKEPYLTSRITQIDADGREIVVMRADAPRLFTVFGAYVFPLENSLVSLSILPAAEQRRDS